MTLARYRRCEITRDQYYPIGRDLHLSKYQWVHEDSEGTIHGAADTLAEVLTQIDTAYEEERV